MLVRPEEIISVTDVQRNAKDIFSKLSSGDLDKFVVLRNNTLAAVMLTAERYESLLDELEDLRIEAIAWDRLASFDSAMAITHEDMLTRFEAETE
jgi:antitoxin StbD